MSDFVNARITRSRRGYRCGDCSRRIPSGTPYTYLVGRTDGDFWVYARCMDCSGGIHTPQEGPP